MSASFPSATPKPSSVSAHLIARLAQAVEAEFGIRDLELELTQPNLPKFGDYSSNVALQLVKRLTARIDEADGSKSAHLSSPSNPRQIAEQLQQRLTAEPDPLVETIKIAGPGFINFYLTNQVFLTAAYDLATTKTLMPKAAQLKKFVVEYSSPNIAKPFTIGHLRSTIIGDAVANLLESNGHQVYRDNHLGDWGTQFGKQIYAIKTWGNEAEINASAEPVKLLVALYVKFHQAAEADPSLEAEGRAWFKRLEDGDPEARRLWKKCIDWSLKEFRRIYDRLNITFTENNGQGYGESFFEDKMAAVIEELKAKKLIRESRGAWLFFFPDDVLPPLMLLKNDGATLYATRDLATDKFRLEHYGAEVVVINEVGAEQSLYWRQVYLAEETLGWYQPGQRVHVKHGLYRFKDKKMSTRKGDVIWLEDVLQEAFNRVQAVAGDRIDQASLWKIAIGALKWNDLKRSSLLDVTFDWDEIVRLQGNSGPYLQYTAVRCQSILDKAEVSITDHIDILPYVLTDSEKAVIRHLLNYQLTILNAAKDFAPHQLCTYLYELAQAFNAFYTQHSVLGEGVKPEAKAFRLALTTAVERALTQGLGLLGIQTVAKM